MNVPRAARGADSAPDIPLRALVLTAGLGTRLRPLTYLRAKAAVPVNGEPLARRAIRWLVDQGVRDLVLNLHHLPATVTGVVGDGSDLGARVRYTWEQPVLGSAGGPRRALPLLVPANRGTFIIVNGDTLTDVDLAAMVALHAETGAAVTMALIPNPSPDKYGGVKVSDGRWVTGFTRAGTAPESYHFIGVQIVNSGVFVDLQDGVPAETVNALYPRLIADNPRSINACISGASFRDIGTPADYLGTALELAAAEGDRMISGRSRVHAGASIVRTAVWDDVTIGDRADLVECIVCDGANVPAGARYRRCAIVPAGGRSPQPDERVEGGLLIRDIG